MASLARTLPFNPLFPSRPRAQPLSLSSFDSNLFGLHLYNPNLVNSNSLIHAAYSSSAHHGSISARYGGGSSRFGGGDYRRSRDARQSSNEDDQALDISTIKSATVRLIDERQNMVGVVSKSEAVKMAEDAELDLVILSPDADPPVVRLMDYNKYKYELQKKKREQQKKSSANRMDLKELKMGYNIDVHDYTVRLKAAKKFLKDGDKVKVIVNLKGRENEFRNNAIELLMRFRTDVGELATEEAKNLRDRNMFIVLIPNKVVAQKAQESLKKKEKSAVNEVSAGV
ncbi:translation initiation factor IF3-4, chloroplastic-like [Cornus florida]|uniref:translation initiation factor IF3-4, chloroplastic-like n=1 Tax=Cornus florida TaxID=4283 RepID=UPI002898EF48|nr:translation initiation factor IF3-4, chloroplastic-like [Cornus florida]XP_059637702.1 translation initiation factor IF3-4, chloroplastic-like [Cornus florida]